MPYSKSSVASRSALCCSFGIFGGITSLFASEREFGIALVRLHAMHLIVALLFLPDGKDQRIDMVDQDLCWRFPELHQLEQLIDFHTMVLTVHESH
jgi:hypothetical protein